MNYQRIYVNLVTSRKNLVDHTLKRRLGYERHHIIPRAHGGTNDEYNLVSLTDREHMFAHLLLYKIYKSGEMANAINRMLGNKTRSSKLYSKIKEDWRKWFHDNNSGVKNHFYGKHHTDEMKRRHSEMRRGISCWTEESRIKARETSKRNKSHYTGGMKDHKHTEETKFKISQGNKGKIISEEQRRKISQTLIRRQGELFELYIKRNNYIDLYKLILTIIDPDSDIRTITLSKIHKQIISYNSYSHITYLKACKLIRDIYNKDRYIIIVKLINNTK